MHFNVHLHLALCAGQPAFMREPWSRCKRRVQGAAIVTPGRKVRGPVRSPAAGWMQNCSYQVSEDETRGTDHNNVSDKNPVHYIVHSGFSCVTVVIVVDYERQAS